MSAEAMAVDNYVSGLHLLGAHRWMACSSVVLVDLLLLLAETDDSGGENRRTSGRAGGGLWTRGPSAALLGRGMVQCRCNHAGRGR
jgi:hypothetical protein